MRFSYKLFVLGCFILLGTLVKGESLPFKYSQIEQLTATNLAMADSVLNQLWNEPDTRFSGPDSVQLMYYSAYTLVNRGNIDTALALFKQCVLLAETHKMHPINALCLCEIGNIYYNWGEYSEALRYFLLAQKLSLQANDLNGQAEALNYIGKYHHSMGDFHKSADYFKQAMRLASKAKNTNLQAVLYANMGKYYESIGQYQQALKQYIYALSMIDSIENRITRGTVYNHLGNVYQALGNYPQSIDYHYKSLDERITLGYTEGISKSYKNIGEVLLEQNLPDTAMVYFKLALAYAEKVNYQKGIIKAMLDIGAIYLAQNATQTCRGYAFKALQLSQKSGYDKGVIQANLLIGESYFNDKQFKTSEPYLLSSLRDAQTADMADKVCESHQVLSKLYRQLGDTAKTFTHLTQYYESQMAIANERSAKQVAELEYNYQMAQKEKANEILRKENEISTLTIVRKNTFIGLISVILLFTVAFVIAYYLRYKAKQKANQQLAQLNTEIIRQNRALTRLNEQLSQANREKDNFFSIIAHEVRNPLWWFRNLAETLSHNYKQMPEDKLGKAIQSLDESAKNAFHLMDNLLQWSKSQLNRTPFSPTELNLTELMEENLRLWKTAAHYKNIEIEVDAPESVKILADRDMVNTIIRNLLSNAIKYTHTNGKIQLSASQNNGNVVLSVKDSGIGISKSNLKKLFDPNHQYSTLGIMQEKGSGIGLKLCKDFVELNQGKIEVESLENVGTTFNCRFPAFSGQVH